MKIIRQITIILIITILLIIVIDNIDKNGYHTHGQIKKKDCIPALKQKIIPIIISSWGNMFNIACHTKNSGTVFPTWDSSIITVSFSVTISWANYKR